MRMRETEILCRKKAFLRCSIVDEVAVCGHRLAGSNGNGVDKSPFNSSKSVPANRA